MKLVDLGPKDNPQASQDFAKFLSGIPSLLALTVGRLKLQECFYKAMTTVSSSSQVVIVCE